ncbi:MAG TPA: helix-turn-helix domain-containing protein [Nocardioidaceae bacterium]|nr:helix-turn-helix domain-containing protein [Nocardioidaceae bacterium]
MDSEVEEKGLGGAAAPASISTTQELADTLTALRHRAGISIRKLASVTGIPPATLGGYFSGRHLPSVSQGGALQDMLAALGVCDEDEVAAWLDAVRRLRARASGPATEPAPNPYRGLRSFTEEDADRFFGREAYVAEVLDALRDQESSGPGIVALVAPSGAGKSSLLLGGVVPALHKASPPVDVSVIVPGADPVAALAALETQPEVLVVDQFEEIFAPGVPEEERRAFVDRLAALVRLGPTAGRRETTVLFGLRADFYGEVLRDPVLLPALREAQVVLGPMSEDELRRAITGPARTVGVTVEDELVEVLLRDLAPRGPRDGSGAHRPGALPLMSHALMTAWDRHAGDRLTVRDYLATGGIAGAVQGSAESAYASLSHEAQAMAHQLFSRLVNVDDEGVLTRRRARHTELRYLQPTDDGPLSVVLERFIAARLLTATDSTVEISHEALLDAWPRLWEWIEADRDALRVRRRVASAATLWAEQGHDEGVLLRGAPLAAAVELLDHDRDLLTPVERDFVKHSQAREGADLLAQLRRSRRLGQLLVAMTVLAVVAGVLAVLAYQSRTEARQQRAAADLARDAALSRQVAAEADRLMGNDPTLAKQLAVAAYEISPTLKARSSLLDATSYRDATRFVGPDGSMHASASPDGAVLALAGADGRVRLWQRDADGAHARVAQVVGDPRGGLLFASAFSPDRRVLAVGGISGTVRLFDVANPAVPRLLVTLDDPGSAVQSLAFSQDGEVLSAATSDPAVFRWRVSGDKAEALPAVTRFDGAVRAVAFSPVGDVMATGSEDGMLRLWSVQEEDARLVAEESVGETNAVLGVAFSPDGQTLAAGAKDKVVRLWSVGDPARPRPLRGPDTTLQSLVNSVAFSADGSELAAGGSDGTARVWDVASGAQTARMSVSANVTNVAFVGERGGLLTGSLDGTARLWALESRRVEGLGDNVWSIGYDESGTRLLVAPGTGDGAVHVYDVQPDGTPIEAAALEAPSSAGVLDGAAAMTPAGDLLAGGTDTGHVVVWESAGSSFEEAAVLAPSTELIEAVAFSADGRLLASVGDDGAVVVWDAALLRSDAGGAEVARLEVDTIPLGVALSPDGSLLAVTGADNRVHLWDLSSGAAQLEPLAGFRNYAIGVAFSPDGRLLAAGSSDATVRVWDVSTRPAAEAVGRPLTGPTDTVYAVAWDPSGDVLAGASTDGSVWAWDLTDPAHPEPRANLLALTGDAFTVAFTPDGSHLSAAGGDRMVRVWDMSLDAAKDRVCASVGTPITREEWRRYVPGAPYAAPCE